MNYWLHCRHLLVDNMKMSKSLGNFFTLRDLLDQGFKPKGIRYALLATHYRQPMNFTLDNLRGAETGVQRLLDFMDNLQAANGSGSDMQPLLQQTREGFEKSLDDDLNISGALGAIFQMVRDVNRMRADGQLSSPDARQVQDLMHHFDTVLGVLDVDEAAHDADVEGLLAQRQEARKNRDFGRADALRDAIRERGYVIEDTPHGPRLKRM